MKTALLLAILAATMLLEGCVPLPLMAVAGAPLIVQAPLIEGAQQGYDGIRRDPLHADAASGDPAAQYKLGDTYCCHGGGPMDSASIYDNDKATHWYCQAAHQRYGPAQFRLARLYSGHPIRGVHIALRASAMIGTFPTDPGLALMWASVAADNGVQDAIALRDEITAHATGQQRARAAALKEHWQTAPCRWGEVFPSASNNRSAR